MQCVGGETNSTMRYRPHPKGRENRCRKPLDPRMTLKIRAPSYPDLPPKLGWLPEKEKNSCFLFLVWATGLWSLHDLAVPPVPKDGEKACFFVNGKNIPKHQTCQNPACFTISKACLVLQAPEIVGRGSIPRPTHWFPGQWGPHWVAHSQVPYPYSITN